MKIAYIRSSRKQEIEQFAERAGADRVLCDISGTTEFDKIKDTVNHGDTLIIKSVDNACSNILELCCLVKTLDKLNAKLFSIDGDASKLQTKDGKIVLAMMVQLIETEKKSNIKPGRRSKFPEGFLEVYTKFKAGEINSRKAAEDLNIALNTFYTLVRVYDS